MKPTVVITAAIPYINARPHAGHAVEMIQADVLARFCREQGASVRFICGTDENSLTNVLSAKKTGRPIKEYVNEYAAIFRGLGSQYNISNDIFIRTTEERHVLGAQKLWQAFKPEDLYLKDYEGLYCVRCEEFKVEKDLVDGLCPDHQIAPEEVKERNYFFKLSNYQKHIEELLESDQLRVQPEHRKNEILQFVRGGLEDFSISRSVERAEGWGVPVPGDPSQIMYVWVDALSGYITALDYATDGAGYQTYWQGSNQRLHVIGKGILRFHAVYWPAFLLSAGLPLPTDIFVHEYFTTDGQKMSKSLGNVIDPEEITQRYGVDGARYVLLSSLGYGRDGDISWTKMDDKYTADLVNGLGNLLQRTLVLMNKFAIASPEREASRLPEIKVATEQYQFAEALGLLWQRVAAANAQLEREAPWKEEDPSKRSATLQTVSRELAVIARELTPYLPDTAVKIQKQLSELTPEPLFPRLASER